MTGGGEPVSARESAAPTSPAAGAGADAARGLRDPVIWGVLALAFGVRAAPVVAYPRIAIWNDESLHYVASAIAAHVDAPVLGHWPPAYELFLGAIFRLAGPWPVSARWLQVIVSTATVAFVYGIARAAGGRRSARIAALLCALYPSLIAYSHYLYSETLYSTLLTAALFVWVRSPEGPRRGELAAAGILFGLTALTRSLALYFLPVWLGWQWLRGRRREAGQAAVVLLFAVATVAPWTARNAVVMGAFVPIDTSLGRTAWWAYNESPYAADLGFNRLPEALGNRPACELPPRADGEPLPRAETLLALFPPESELGVRPEGRLAVHVERIRREAVADRVGLQSCEVAGALRFIRDHPGVALWRVLHRVYLFVGPNSFLLRSVQWDSYPDGLLGRAAYPLVKAAVVSSYVALVVLALLGFAVYPDRSGVARIALYASFTLALHALTVASSRYRLPLMPLLCVVAGSWLARPGWPRGAQRGGALVAGIAAFGAICVHYAATVLP